MSSQSLFQDRGTASSPVRGHQHSELVGPLSFGCDLYAFVGPSHPLMTATSGIG